MELIFTILILVYTFGQSYGCSPDWNNRCKSNKDCCSGNCVKEGNWEYGVCHPRANAASPKIRKCFPNWYNKCTADDQCCSGFCEKEGNWKHGVCKTSSEPEPSGKPGGRGPSDDNSFEECGKAPGLPRTMIRGGADVTPGYFPWHAGIYELKNGKHEQVCGGSLISSKIVISAAHCFVWDNQDERKIYFKDLNILKVGLGKHYRDINANENYPAQIRDVREVKISPKYDALRSHYQGDIAIVVLKEKVEFTKTVIPVCIDIGETNFERRQLVNGKRGKVVGWGLTNTRDMSEKLMLTEMPYVARDECKMKIGSGWLSYLSDEKICVGSENSESNICQGDSGGGLVFLEKRRHYLRAIVSLGPTCDGSEGYALFTRLSSYKDLIAEYV